MSIAPLLGMERAGGGESGCRRRSRTKLARSGAAVGKFVKTEKRSRLNTAHPKTVDDEADVTSSTVEGTSTPDPGFSSAHPTVVMSKKRSGDNGRLEAADSETPHSGNDEDDFQSASDDNEDRGDSDNDECLENSDNSIDEHCDTTGGVDSKGQDNQQASPIDVESSTFEQAEPSYHGAKKKHTPGIIYLSYIPEGLTVAKTREILAPFGNLGRIYFEPIKRLNNKTRPNHRFAEGWVEFEKKRIAKKVAESLNTKPVGGKRRAPYHDALWSMKYLHRFRWPHLSERLAYEKAVKDQRLRTEIAQAKREANYYAKALERSIRLRKQRKQQANQGDDGEATQKDPPSAGSHHCSSVRLKKTDREIRQEKNEGPHVDKKLLMSIFSK